MCCHVRVTPLLPKTALLILRIALFKPVGRERGTGYAVPWEREIPEENTAISARLMLTEGTLEFHLLPGVSLYAHHFAKRITASLCFEVAAKYAERVDGTITQMSNVEGCRGDDPKRLLACYPDMPLTFERICAGFRETLGGASPTT